MASIRNRSILNYRK